MSDLCGPDARPGSARRDAPGRTGRQSHHAIRSGTSLRAPARTLVVQRRALGPVNVGHVQLDQWPAGALARSACGTSSASRSRRV
jgi:hypothetical protein